MSLKKVTVDFLVPDGVTVESILNTLELGSSNYILDATQQPGCPVVETRLSFKTLWVPKPENAAIVEISEIKTFNGERNLLIEALHKANGKIS